MSKYIVNGEWTGRYQYRGRDLQGKQFRKVFPLGYTKAQAQEALDLKLVKLRERSHIPANKMTMNDWFDEWLMTVKETNRESSYDNACETVDNRLRPYIGHIKLQELTEDDIRDAYRALVELGRATNTIRGVHRRLRPCLRAAVAERKISYSPAENVRPPKGRPQKKMRVWTFEQLKTFDAFVATQRDAAMWAFWVTTGLRRGELCGLTWDKVDLDAGVVRIDHQRTVSPRTGKVLEGTVKTTNGVREVPISPRVVESLRAWRSSQSALRLAQGDKWKGGNFVFTSYRNTPYYPGSFGQRLTSLAKRAGVPNLSPHELRHTYGTRAAENGMQDTVLQRIMGHSRIEVTKNLYIHPNLEQAKEANDSLAERMFG